MPKAPTVDFIPVGAFACPGVILNLDALLTGAQAARYLGITRQSIYMWHKRGEITATRVDGNWMYRLRDVLETERTLRRRRAA